MADKKAAEKCRARHIFQTAAFCLATFVLSACAGKTSEEEETSAQEEIQTVQEDAYDTGDSDADSSDYREITWDGETYVYNDHLSNFLFLGIDTREKAETRTGVANAGQSDALYLVSWDRVENTAALIAIPRDTMTQIEVFAYTGESLGLTEDHINLAYAYGDGGEESCELAEAAVSRLFYGLPIQGVCALSIDGIPVLLESIGNVTVTVPNDSLEAEYPEFAEGAQATITPENAETFLRKRDTSVSQSAIARMERQLAFLTAVAEKLEANPQDAAEAYEALTPYLSETMGLDWILKLAQGLADGTDIAQWTVPGEGVEGEYYDEYYVDDDALYQKIVETFYEKAE